MATLTVQQAVPSGAAISLVAASAGGDDFPNDGRTVFVAKTTGTDATLTFNRTKPCSHGFDHDIVQANGATAEKHYGPFPVDQFGESVAVTYSGVTGLTVAARRTP